MKRITTTMVSGLAAALVVLALGTLSASAQSRSIATASLDKASAPIGGVVQVRGSGWPANSLVLIELCGNDAANGSTDCNQTDSTTTTASADGVVLMAFAVPEPSVPCPCAVRLTTAATSATASVPLAVEGAATAGTITSAAPAAGTRNLEVTASEIRGGSFLGLLGLPTSRTVTFTVRNTGTAPLSGATVDLVAGAGDDPTGYVDPVQIGALAPGEERTYEASVQTGPLSMGTLTTKGTIVGAGEVVTFSAQASTTPWLLVLLVLAGSAATIIVVVRRRRRRLPSEDVYGEWELVAP